MISNLNFHITARQICDTVIALSKITATSFERNQNDSQIKEGGGDDMVDDDIKKTGNYLFEKLSNAQKNVSELENSLDSARNEVYHLKMIIHRLNLCMACLVVGNLHRYTSKENECREACPTCKGKGQIIPD